MASSVPESSNTASSGVSPAREIGRNRVVPGLEAGTARAELGAQYPSAIVRALTIPAAFFATNWAALLAMITVAGLIPALTAATRTTVDLRAHADHAFRTTLGNTLTLLKRDWPISLGTWLLLGLIAGNATILSELAKGGTRVFLVGIAVPPTWLTISYLSAWVITAAAGDLKAPRGDVAAQSLALVVRRPVRALLVPIVILALSPLWLLAPLTIAIGFSVPPFLVAQFWGSVTPQANSASAAH